MGTPPLFVRSMLTLVALLPSDPGGLGQCARDRARPRGGAQGCPQRTRGVRMQHRACSIQETHARECIRRRGAYPPGRGGGGQISPLRCLRRGGAHRPGQPHKTQETNPSTFAFPRSPFTSKVITAQETTERNRNYNQKHYYLPERKAARSQSLNRHGLDPLTSNRNPTQTHSQQP